jgi:peptidoglycan hydrolase CwlO-like protein
LKHEVSKLDRDTVSHIGAIAKKKVAVDHLAKEVKDLEADLGKQKNRILVLRDGLEGKKTFVTENGTVIGKDRIAKDLAKSVAAYKTTSLNLETKKELLIVEEENLEAAKNELRAMQQAKHDLEVELSKLEAEVKKVQTGEAKGRFLMDNSRLTRIKKEIERIKNRAKVMQEKLKLQEEFGSTPIPAKERVNEKDLLKAVDNLFKGEANK